MKNDEEPYNQDHQGEVPKPNLCDYHFVNPIIQHDYISMIQTITTFIIVTLTINWALWQLSQLSSTSYRLEDQCTMQQGLTFEKKSYHEMFNFENLFLCQFSSNTRFSFGGGSLNTPKIGKCKKEFTNINLRGFKAQKT